jgi:hypothetical protein
MVGCRHPDFAFHHSSQLEVKALHREFRATRVWRSERGLGHVAGCSMGRGSLVDDDFDNGWFTSECSSRLSATILGIEFFIRPDASPRDAARKALRMRAEGGVHKRMQACLATRICHAHMHAQIDAIVANSCTYTTQLKQ